MDAKPIPEQEEYGVISKFSQLNLDTDQLQVYDRQEVSVEVVTWNTNCSKGRGHFSAIRDTLIPIVKKPFKNCITFMQEIKICDESVKTRWEFGECEVSMTSKSSTGLSEAAIATPPRGNQLEYESGEIRDSNGKEVNVKDEFAKRMYGQKVTLKKKIGESEYTASIIMVSYHAHHKDEVSNKREKILEYFDEICKFADTLNQTIIIGGDFNLPVLDWKDEVEDKFKDRVSVALYVGTPRRWNRARLIDTFAVVQPEDPEYRTEATFEETIGIYQFPMAGRVGGDQPTALRNYPSSENRWFKYLHFNDADLEKIKGALAKKDDGDLASLKKKFKKDEEEKKDKKDAKVTESPKEDTEERMKQVPEENAKVKLPKEDKVPEEDAKVKFPIEDKMKQVPEEDEKVKLPKEDQMKQVPEEDEKVKFSIEEKMKQVPEEDVKVKVLEEDTKVKMKELPKDTETDTNEKFPKEDTKEKMKELPEEIQKDEKEKLLKEDAEDDMKETSEDTKNDRKDKLPKGNTEENNMKQVLEDTEKDMKEKFPEQNADENNMKESSEDTENDVKEKLPKENAEVKEPSEDTEKDVKEKFPEQNADENNMKESSEDTENDVKEKLPKENTEENNMKEPSEDTEKDVKKKFPEQNADENMKESSEDMKEKFPKEDTKKLQDETLLEKDAKKKLLKEDKVPEETHKDAKKLKKEPSKDEAEEKEKSSKSKKKKKQAQSDRIQYENIKDGKHLSEPFAEVNPCGTPAPLWPNSCLHQVLDHDPVWTKIRITLKRNNSAQDNTPTTPE